MSREEVARLIEAVQSDAGAVLRNVTLLAEALAAIDPEPTPEPAPGPTPEPGPGPTPPAGIPALDWDPVDRATLTPVGTVRLPPGGTLTNALVRGVLVLPETGGYTVRNCRVEYGGTGHAVQQVGGDRGDPGMIDGLSVRTTNMVKGAASALLVRNGSTVRRFRLEGTGDGLKMWHGCTYEDFVIVVSKVPGSAKHADGIQNSGKSGCTARRGRVENGRLTGFKGGNAGIFVQAFNGASDVPTRDVTFEDVAVDGGQFLLAVGQGKTQRSGLLERIVFRRIVCGRNFYGAGPFRLGDGGAAVTLQGAVWEDDGRPVT